MLEHKCSQRVDSFLNCVQVGVAADVHQVLAAVVERVDALDDLVDKDLDLTVLLFVGLMGK